MVESLMRSKVKNLGNTESGKKLMTEELVKQQQMNTPRSRTISCCGSRGTITEPNCKLALTEPSIHVVSSKDKTQFFQCTSIAQERKKKQQYGVRMCMIRKLPLP